MIIKAEPEWISRKRFLDEKESNTYIKIIWSFGNNGEDYLLGKDLEAPKRSMHQAVVFDEFDGFMKDIFKIDRWPNHLTITGKRLYLKRICGHRTTFANGGNSAVKERLYCNSKALRFFNGKTA